MPGVWVWPVSSRWSYEMQPKRTAFLIWWYKQGSTVGCGEWSCQGDPDLRCPSNCRVKDGVSLWSVYRKIGLWRWQDAAASFVLWRKKRTSHQSYSEWVRVGEGSRTHWKSYSLVDTCCVLLVCRRVHSHCVLIVFVKTIPVQLRFGHLPFNKHLFLSVVDVILNFTRGY